MYFEPGRCVHCGQTTSPVIHGVATSPAPVGFGFCSEVCREQAIAPFMQSDGTAAFELEFNRIQQRKVSQALTPDYMRSPEFIAMERKQDSLWQQVQEGKRKFGDPVRKAEDEYFKHWDANRVRIRDEKWKQEDAKRAERHARELAKIQEQARKQKEKEMAEAAERAAFDEMIKPRPIPDEPYRYEHTHILAPSGSGKTAELQDIFLNDIAKENPPAHIILDPKGLMVKRIAHLDVFHPDHGRLRDRLVIIDPSQEPPPALNMFQFQLHGASERDKNRVANQLLTTFGYIFSSADSRLTTRQSVPFSFVVRLIFQMGGDLNTLMDVLSDTDPNTSPFKAHIKKLGETNDGARRFFETDFYRTSFAETRSQVRARIYDIIGNPDLMAMFGAPENKLDLFDCIQSRKIVLVNTGLTQLGSKGSQLLGRYIIAQALVAAYTRFTVPQTEWNPAFLMIDELQDFVDDDKIPELLRLAREYKMGVIMAHQVMHVKEISETVRTSISTNTSIKYCSTPEGVDMNYMARDLRCEPEFLSQQTKTETHGKFACFVRGLGLTHPFSHQIFFKRIEQEPQMPEEAYQRLLVANAQRLAATPLTQAAPVPTQSPPPSPTSFDAEPQTKW